MGRKGWIFAIFSIVLLFSGIFSISFVILNMKKDDNGINNDKENDFSNENEIFGTIQDLSVEFFIEEYWGEFNISINVSNPTNRTILTLHDPFISSYHFTMRSENNTELLNYSDMYPDPYPNNDTTSSSTVYYWKPGSYDVINVLWESNPGNYEDAGPWGFHIIENEFPIGKFNLNFTFKSMNGTIFKEKMINQEWLFETSLNIRKKDESLQIIHYINNTKKYPVNISCPNSNVQYYFYIENEYREVIRSTKPDYVTPMYSADDYYPLEHRVLYWNMSCQDFEKGQYFGFAYHEGIRIRLEKPFLIE